MITDTPLTTKRVIKTWLPLVTSWALMSIELPLINAIIARLAYPEINLAAYGGVVYPLALIIEAPVIMLLAASTAFSRDWVSFKYLRKITWIMGVILSGLHLLIAATPIFDFIVNVILRVPPEVVEPARMGLLVMTPWTLGIAVRRVHQGAMIRFNRSHMVSETTIIRLVTVSVILTIALIVKRIPGAVVAGMSQGLAVSAEGIYASLRLRKIIPEIKAAPKPDKPLILKRFLIFYVPLAATSAVSLLWLSFISGAISRMADPLESLAVWSVLTGLFFLFRSPGLAYNEAVVALLDNERSFPILKKFTMWLSLVIAAIAVVFVFSPVSGFWFRFVANLPPGEVEIAGIALALGIPLTALSLYIHFYQGIIVKSEKTRAVFVAVLAFMVLLLGALMAGVWVGTIKGVYIASFAFTAGHLGQGFWLWFRSREQRRRLIRVADNPE